jgi:hypothetical protein
MFITADQLLAHGIGDYVLQSDWMATTKTSKISACLAHVGLYTLCFLPLTTKPAALAIILGSHFVIDHWRLARHVGWAKNFLAPPSARPLPWRECQGTGYAPDKPPFMAVWLMIIVDQLMHLSCNGLALKFFG